MDDIIEKKPEPQRSGKLETNGLNLFYGSFHALRNITMDIQDRAITAIIGPSGCGKSSLLRIFNRMNDLIPGARVEGKVLLDDVHIYEKTVDVAQLRKKVGMVFQKPNVFPMSVYDNIVIGPRHHGITRKRDLDAIAERSLTQAALWAEVKDNLKKPGLDLSPGQQQLLCIARALAVEPEVILLDRPCSGLDPISTAKIEESLIQLKEQFTIVIAPHNVQQAGRISDRIVFVLMGHLIEEGLSDQVFYNPRDQRTSDYITGRFG
ncbi:MAG: phosphate ABC transporter ATP-binding protein PstB [Clostridiales bacterium]|nr:phosphate ABC transporter ATP-binding protein PstB [Clostridiales bacterium]